MSSGPLPSSSTRALASVILVLVAVLATLLAAVVAAAKLGRLAFAAIRGRPAPDARPQKDPTAA